MVGNALYGAFFPLLYYLLFRNQGEEKQLARRLEKAKDLFIIFLFQKAPIHPSSHT